MKDLQVNFQVRLDDGLPQHVCPLNILAVNRGSTEKHKLQTWSTITETSGNTIKNKTVDSVELLVKH